MRRKLSVLMVMGLCFTITASAGTYFYLRSMERKLEAAQNKLEQFSQVITLPVLVNDVARGEELTKENVTSEQISASHIPFDLVRSLEDAVPQDGGPLIARSDLKAGQFLLRTQLVTPSELGSANVLLPVGSRAYALRLDGSSALTDRLAPGDPVDIFWRPNGVEGPNETRLLATSLEVAQPYAVTDASANIDDGTEEPQSGQDALETQVSTTEQIALIGPPEEIALLIQTEGRGQHIVVPANHSAGAVAERVTVTDADVMEKPVSIAPSSETEQDAAPGSLVNENEGSDEADDTIDAIQSLVKAPSTCTLNIIRSATRSVVEVPC